MTTKRIKPRYSNKTKKNQKKRYNTIDTVYLKTDTNTENERRLACFLINNRKINNFAFKLFYYILHYWKTIEPNNWTSIIKHSLIEKHEKNTIIKIGFTEHEYKTIVELVNKTERQQLTNYLETKFLKVTATINSLCEPEYTIYHVNANKILQKTFISYLEKIMLTKDITWKNIMTIYRSLKNKNERNNYNFLVYDLIYGADKKVDSIYRDNLGNMMFFRNRLTNFNHNQQNHKKLNDCNKSIVDDEEDYNKYRIYNSTERYKIEPNSPYAEIMKTYSQKYIGGPSGSTAVLYITLFQLYGFPFTYKNKIMLLGLLIADLVPLWHTVPEILMSAYPEWNDNKIKPYTLDQDPVVYSIQLLKPFV